MAQINPLVDAYTCPNITEIALLGGTFDPIHYGHIEPAKQVATWLGLQQVVLLPAHIPPHKAQPGISARQRADMVRLVCHNDPLLHIDERELTRSTASYTLETLTQIKQQCPHKRLFFIIGMDSLLSFTRWHQWQKILNLCHLVVNTRPGYDLQKLPEQTKQLLAKHQLADQAQLRERNAGGIIFSPTLDIDISSTQLRQTLINRDDPLIRQALTQYLPPKVLDYIEYHQLYL
jgi:nicotinate-nucleotide adenylyltransferase